MNTVTSDRHGTKKAGPSLEGWTRASRGVPIAYFVFAHLCLGVAFGAIAADPWSIAGFFYHPRMLAMVHLVTLGWITCGLLGALYVVVPRALGQRMPAGRSDAWACAMVMAGSSGIVSHFWVDEASGLAWSGGLLLCGLAIPAVRFLRALFAARLPLEIKAPFVFAFFNFLLAGSMGALIGLDKGSRFFDGHFLRGHIHHRVFAHAHLAGIGWTLMLMVAMGVLISYKLVPSLPVPKHWLWATTLALEIGALGIFGGWLGGGSGVKGFAVLTAAGLGLLLTVVCSNLWQQRATAGVRSALLQVSLALVYLVATVAIGVALIRSEEATWELPAVMAYGVFGLIGFLGQLVVAASPWLSSTLAGSSAGGEDSVGGSVTPPIEIRSSALRHAVMVLWALGVPALAVSLATDHVLLLRIAASGLLLAVILQAVALFQILQFAPDR